MPSFGQVQLPDTNYLLDVASGKTTADVARTQIGNQRGQLDNQLLSNTLGSNTRIAGNIADAGDIANQYAPQRNALELTQLKQQLGLEDSPAYDALQRAINPAAPAAPTGGFEQQLGASEAPSSGTVNPGGYSGQFQFGAARLSDPGVGVYIPAKGEDVNANTWGGTFNITGFPDVKTHAQFLASPDAQRAVFAKHVGDIDNAISQTPGADKLNQNGLRAVAHLGGVAGMEKFVATGGAYDPADKNGTRLSDYYNKFSQGGPRALQASFGHPDGPTQAVAAAAPGVTLSPDATAPVAAPVQTATRGPMPGDTVNDGTSAPTQQAPEGQALPDVMAQLRAGQAAPADATPQVQNPNALLSVAAPVGVSAPAPQNALAPVAVAPAPSAPPAPATGMNAPQVQQAQALLRQAAQIEMIAARAPNDPRVKALAAAKVAELRGQAQVLMQADSYAVDPKTGLQTSRLSGEQKSAAIPVHNPSRVTTVQTAGGTLETQPGAPDRLIPFSGRPEQTDAYKGDLTKADALTSAAQSAQASMPRLNEMATLAGELSTGPTAEVRAKAAQVLEQLGASPAAIKGFTGMPSGSAAQEFVKLAIATAGSAAKADVGSNNGIQSTQLYQAANPNLGLLPDANKRITNMMRVSAQSIQDYAQAALKHFGDNETTFLKGGDYSPLTTFNRQWQSQANPQVYAAATGILNGDSFDKWSSKISPSEAMRAAQIAARVDPTVQVPMKGGGMRPVGDILSHPSVAKPN